MHKRSEIWNFSSSFQIDISLVRVVNEWDIKLNTQRETPYLQATMHYFIYSINSLQYQQEVDFIHVLKRE